MTLVVFFCSGCDKSSPESSEAATVTNTVVTNSGNTNATTATTTNTRGRNRSATQGRVRIDPGQIDVGYMLPNTIGKGLATLTNLGAESLTITETKTSCACTVVDLAQKVIGPGESVQLNTELEAGPFPGPLNKWITVSFDSHTPVKVLVKGETAYPVRAKPAIFACPGQTCNGTVNIKSLDGQPFKILSAHGSTPDYVNFDPSSAQQQASYDLKWLLDVSDCSLVPPWWIVETDRADCPFVPIQVSHFCTKQRQPRGRTWSIQSRPRLMRRLTPGQSFDFAVRVTKAAGIEMREIRSPRADIRAELISTRDDTNGVDLLCTIRITPREDVRGFICEHLTIVSQAGEEERILIVARIE